MEICTGYEPGVIGRVVELHGIYYTKTWNFTAFFEAKVATELAAFANYYTPEQDGFWWVKKNNRLEGSIVITGRNAYEEGAHLRWFIMSEAIRGQGLGNQLISKAVDFCKEKNYPSVQLWTFSELHAAKKLYEKVGFKLAKEQIGTQWGVEVIEQQYILEL